MLRRLPVRWVAPILTVGVWEASVALFSVPPFILPAPSAIANALVDGLVRPLMGAGAGFYPHIWVTFYQALIGFAVGAGVGLLLGTLLSQSRILSEAFQGLIVAFQSVPKVALAPLFVIWFGFGTASKIAMVSVLTFFPVFINSMVGFQSVEPERLELMRSLTADRWQTFRMVQLPSALPYIFAGLDMAAVFSIIGAVVGEFVGARQGLGVLLMQMNFAMNTRGVFAVVIILSVMGLLMYRAVQLARRRVVFWQQEDKDPLASW